MMLYQDQRALLINNWLHVFSILLISCLAVFGSTAVAALQPLSDAALADISGRAGISIDGVIKTSKFNNAMQHPTAEVYTNMTDAQLDMSFKGLKLDIVGNYNSIFAADSNSAAIVVGLPQRLEFKNSSLGQIGLTWTADGTNDATIKTQVPANYKITLTQREGFGEWSMRGGAGQLYAWGPWVDGQFRRHKVGLYLTEFDPAGAPTTIFNVDMDNTQAAFGNNVYRDASKGKYFWESFTMYCGPTNPDNHCNRAPFTDQSKKKDSKHTAEGATIGTGYFTVNQQATVEIKHRGDPLYNTAWFTQGRTDTDPNTGVTTVLRPVRPVPGGHCTVLCSGPGGGEGSWDPGKHKPQMEILDLNTLEAWKSSDAAGTNGIVSASEGDRNANIKLKLGHPAAKRANRNIGTVTLNGGFRMQGSVVVFAK